jgi:uncharacterized damage-inducible protein DinB
MGQRANVLADELDSVNRDVVAFCESLSDDDWQTVVPNEQRTVGVLFQHIAVAYTAESALIRAIITGQPLPEIYNDQALLDEVNARDAVDLLPGTRTDTLRSLDRHARRASRFIRSLSDEDLAASATVGIFGGSVWTVEALIERIVLGHPQIHLASIRAALDGS